MWKFEEDDGANLLTVRVTSVMSDGDVMRAKLALKYKMAKRRAAGGPAHIMFDLTHYSGTPTDVIQQFENVDGDFVQGSSDRVALILPTSLDKAMARPLLKWPNQSSLFLSVNAAKLWLAAN